MKKVFFGIIASAVFLYFSFRGIDYIDIKNSFRNTNFFFLLPSFFFFLSILVLKSLRWGVILSPIKKVSQKHLFPISCVGNMAVILFPLRMGEFVKPYLVRNSNSILLSSALATVFVERILDLLCVFFLVIYIFVTLDMPEWLIKAGYSFSVSCLLLICIGFFFYLNTKLKNKFFNPLIKKFSEKLYKKIERVWQTFIQGFQIISDLRKTLFAIFLTILIWICAGLAIYSLYNFQGLVLSLESAFIVLAIVTIGVSVPTIPGSLGNFQFACILALSIFNISKADAAAFSIIYYMLGVGSSILLGFAFIPFTSFSLKTIKQQIFSKDNSHQDIS